MFLFDAAASSLFWDRDGGGAAAKESLILFTTPVTLAADDFILI